MEAPEVALNSTSLNDASRNFAPYNLIEIIGILNNNQVGVKNRNREFSLYKEKE